MTSTGLPPGTAVPIQRAPNLDPADAVHVPRWLAELAYVEQRAQQPRRPGHDLSRLVLPAGQGERGGG